MITAFTVLIAAAVIWINQYSPSGFIFWKVFDYARMIQALLSFPFLIFALPLTIQPLSGALPTGYDAYGKPRG